MNNQRKLVFVYGTLKSGGRLHSILSNNGAIYKGNWFTKPRFTMIHLGLYPGVYQNGKDIIHGELYTVSDLYELDRVEGYPHLFNRSMINTTYGNAYIYIYNGDVERWLDKRISSGYWRTNKDG